MQILHSINIVIVTICKLQSIEGICILQNECFYTISAIGKNEP